MSLRTKRCGISAGRFPCGFLIIESGNHVICIGLNDLNMTLKTQNTSVIKQYHCNLFSFCGGDFGDACVISNEVMF